MASVGVCSSLLVLVLISLTQASYYDDMLVEDLYKRLAEYDEYLGAEEEADKMPYAAWLNDIALDARDPGQADLRDREYQQHSPSNAAFQHISGGAGEGAQHLTPAGTQNNTQEVKSDETLPFYCHPPNPCPKGFTAEDGCNEGVKDTAETQKNWIDEMMRTGRCTCDEEHMFSCPEKAETMNTNKGHKGRDNLDQILDTLLEPETNPYTDGDKTEYVVAKKSPGIYKRSIDARQQHHQLENRGMEGQDYRYNPYLQGIKLPTVAKKGVNM